MAARLKTLVGITVLCTVIGVLGAQTIPGVRGIDQGIFQYHFEKADRETNPVSWMEQARLGRELALGSWERTALTLYEDPVLREEAAGELARWSEEELERRFVEWLSKRFLGEGSGGMALALLQAADTANRIYAYHTDADGNIIYNDDSGDPETVRPFEGRDAEADRIAWRGFVSGAGETELARYGNTLSAYLPELLFYVPEEKREAFQDGLVSAYSQTLSARETEFKALLDREERLFVARRTGDIWSLRKKSENESASAISAQLVKEADALCAEGIASLEQRIESARSGSGDLSLAGNDWLDAFREQFDRGLRAWETAEEQFLIRRMEWERDSGEYFLTGQEAWRNAFAELEKERLAWEEKAGELFRSGEKLFSDVSEQLNHAIAEAKVEFEKDAELRIGNGVERARSWVDMYVTCASVLADVRESVDFWQERFVKYIPPSLDDDTPPSPDDNISPSLDDDTPSSLDDDVAPSPDDNAPPSLENGTLASWVEDILGSDLILNAEQRMAGRELVRWSALYIQYRDKAEEAKAALEQEFALALGTNAGGLTDVLSASSEDFHLDEYQVEILRARAVAGYWEQRLAVAEAVSAYAEELTAGRLTEAESLSAWRNAKAGYDAALTSYSAVQERLGEANLAVAEAREEMRGAALALEDAERRLEELNRRYALQMASYLIDSRDFILEELASYYVALIEQWEERKHDDAYYTGYLKALRNYSDASNLAESWGKLESVVSELEEGELRAMKLALLGAESAADWYFVFGGKEASEEERRLLEEEGLLGRLERDAEKEAERDAEENPENEPGKAALMLEVYRELAPYSQAARKEAVFSALKGMARIFAEYGITAVDGTLPSTGLAGKALFDYANEQEIDYEKAAAEFFVKIDKETMFVPDWIEQETASWKNAVLAYLAAKTVYEGKTPPENSSFASEMYREREEKIKAIYFYDLQVSLGETPDFEKPEEDYRTLASEAAYYRYLYEYLAAFENESGIIDDAEDDAEHWRTYVSAPFFDQYNLNKNETARISTAKAGNPEEETAGIKGALSWEEGFLADAWENAEKEREKLERAFSLFLDSPIDSFWVLFTETAKNHLDDSEFAWENLFDETSVEITYEFYTDEQKKLKVLSDTSEALAAEISRLGLGFKRTPEGGIEAREEMERISGELEKLRLSYQSVFVRYAEAAGAFAQAGSFYEGIYARAKNLFTSMETARLEYEKQDAVRRWAGTAYLYSGGEYIETAYYKEPREELAYAGERAGRARMALKALEDMYNNDEEKRPYDNEEYNRLYEDYKVSFSRMFLAMKAQSELEAVANLEKSNNASLYNSLSAQAASYVNPALVDFFSGSEAGNPWFNYITLTGDGKLSLSYDPHTFRLRASGISSENSYFENERRVIDGSSQASAFESALAEWSVRMKSYRLDNMGKFLRWGLAFDYLVRNLIESNPDVWGINGSYTLNNLGENGSLKLDGESLNSLLSDFRLTSLPGLQHGAYNSLSGSEKADLGFLAALFLSGGGGAGAGGLTMSSDWHEMRWMYGEADWFRVHQSFLFFSWVIYRWPYTIDSSEVDYIRDFSRRQAGSIYNMINSRRGEYANSIAGLSQVWIDYRQSCENLAMILGNKNGETGGWAGAEKALAALHIFTDEDISELHECWDEMFAYHDKRGEPLLFTDNISALEALVTWTKGKRNGIKEQLEAAYAGDESRRGEAQDEYRKILDLYIDGSKTLAELNDAAEAAYGIHSPALKNHLENLGAAMLSDLEGIAGEKSGYAVQFRELALEYEDLIERVYRSRFDAELASREMEWEKQRKDLVQKIVSWKEASGLILERGRSDWDEGFENMLERNEKWAGAFQEEYDRLDAAWNAAYLESLQEKESWITRAAEAADNALQGALLSSVGSDAEAGSRKFAAFFPSALPGFGGAEEAGKILRDVLASAGIKSLTAAFDAVNGNAKTAGVAIRTGNSGLGLWNTGQAHTAAKELARKGTEELASHKMKILAFQARESATQAKALLDRNIESANRNFNEDMDEMFTMGAGWLKSGNIYVRDIIVHSTLFQSVITDRVTVDTYKWFVLEYWDFTTNLSDSYLEGLDYFAVETIIGLAQDEVRRKSESVFGNASGEIGLFAGWIGEAPEMSNGVFVKNGNGELGRLLREYYTYSLKQSQGIALVNAPLWDKPLWDSRGSWFSAPNLRSVADIAMTAVSAAAVAATPLTGGASLLLGTAINLTDDALFGGLDIAGGYKSWDEAGFVFGQKALMTAVSSATGAVFNGFGGVAEGSTGFFNTGGLSGYVNRTLDQGFGKVLSQGALSGARALTAGTITGALGAVTYSGENGFGWSGNSFTSGLYGSFAGAASAGAGSLVGNTFSWINTGENADKLVGFSRENISNVASLNNFIGSLAGEGVNYAFTEELALNLFNLNNIKGFSDINLGLLELHLGKSGTNMNLGSSGADVSYRTLAETFRGADVWSTNSKINDFAEREEIKIAVSLRAQYGFGDDVQKKQLTDILRNDIDLIAVNREGAEAESKMTANGKVIYLNEYSETMDISDQMRLAAILGHEAYRDGLDENGIEELKTASIGRIMMSDRINQDYDWFYGANIDFAIESALYSETKGTGVFDYYLEESYHNDEDYFWQKIKTGGAHQNEDRFRLIPLLAAKSKAEVDEINNAKLNRSVERCREILASEEKGKLKDYNLDSGMTDEEIKSILTNSANAKLRSIVGYNPEAFISLFNYGCKLMSTIYMAESITGKTFDPIEVNKMVLDKKLYTGEDMLSTADMVNIVRTLTDNEYTLKLVESGKPTMEKIKEYAASPRPFIAHIRAVKNEHSEVFNVQCLVDSVSLGLYYAIRTVNPWSGEETKPLSKTKLTLAEIDRWDVFMIERTFEGRWKDRNAK